MLAGQLAKDRDCAHHGLALALEWRGRLQQLRHIAVCARATSALDTHDVMTLSSQQPALCPGKPKLQGIFFCVRAWWLATNLHYMSLTS